MRYEVNKGDGSRSEEGVIEFAETKLICAASIVKLDEPERRAAELAILGVRLLPSIEPVRRAPSQNVEEYLVERNMRVAYSVPQHRQYMRSGYSSEPILAEAAANLMRELRTVNGKACYDFPGDRIARILKGHVEDGLVSKGELGELTGRLLLILAMDSAQEAAQSVEIARGMHPRWSKPVGVIDFMKALFGNENYNELIRNCAPDNGSGEAFDDQFKNSVVRFTHFARADDDSGVTTGAALAAFLRGLAVQCHPYQPSADIAVAMLMDKNKPVVEENMSIMLISLKNKSRASNINDTAVDADQLGCFPESDFTDLEEQDRGIRPYISLVMELGIQPKTLSPPKNYPQTTAGTLKRSNDVESAATRKKAKTIPFARHAPIDSNLQALRRSARIRKKQPVHPRYLIRVRGCSPSVYSVVQDKDVYAHLLHARPIFTEHSRPEEFVTSVRRLKPLFSAGPDGRGHYQKIYIETTREADVTADTIEAGKAPGEDMESEDNGE